jgi:hypothetical protein
MFEPSIKMFMQFAHYPLILCLNSISTSKDFYHKFVYKYSGTICFL